MRRILHRFRFRMGWTHRLVWGSRRRLRSSWKSVRFFRFFATTILLHPFWIVIFWAVAADKWSQSTELRKQTTKPTVEADQFVSIIDFFRKKPIMLVIHRTWCHACKSGLCFGRSWVLFEKSRRDYSLHISSLRWCAVLILVLLCIICTDTCLSNDQQYLIDLKVYFT